MADSSHVIDQRSLDLLASLPFADHGIPASQPASQPASHHASQPASIHATQLDQATMRPYSLEDYDEALQRDQAILSARFKENPKVTGIGNIAGVKLKAITSRIKQMEFELSQLPEPPVCYPTCGDKSLRDLAYREAYELITKLFPPTITFRQQIRAVPRNAKDSVDARKELSWIHSKMDAMFVKLGRSEQTIVSDVQMVAGRESYIFHLLQVEQSHNGDAHTTKPREQSAEEVEKTNAEIRSRVQEHRHHPGKETLEELRVLGLKKVYDLLLEVEK